jgi:hypothetical protein
MTAEFVPTATPAVAVSAPPLAPTRVVESAVAARRPLRTRLVLAMAFGVFPLGYELLAPTSTTRAAMLVCLAGAALMLGLLIAGSALIARRGSTA